ncbi:MAG: hypothetical protein PHH60_05330, partial [Candidatus Margulisbacteria bacterium]|nr:hypothetical protein [Candidatus Margulisiibacteriota bacterium]
MRKTILFSLVILLSISSADAVLLSRVRFGSYPDKIRAVFDFDGAFAYEADESKEKIVLHLKKTEASPDIQSYVELNDLIVRYMEIEKNGDDLKISIPLTEPIKYNIFYLNDPPRLVLDFDRDFINIVSGGSITDGVEFLKVKKGLIAGRINANVLKIDLAKAEVRPALAKKQKPSIIESFVNLIAPWTQDKPTKHFFLDKVSNIMTDNDALAGVNGTYFASTGSPLGVLMIDQELVSSPIYDRTAFFLDEKNRPYIDNVFVACQFTAQNGTRYKINSINQGRGENDVIMYTPAWGESTQTNQQGVEIVVSRAVVTGINVANSKIPEDGYVLSLCGPGVETIADNVKIGDKINIGIKLVPYTAAPEKIIHLISGG